MTGRTVLVVAGGSESSLPKLGAIGRTDAVVAADSGLDLAFGLGLRVDTAVGDFDSVSEGALRRAQSEGVELVSYPTSKDRSDLELAMVRASELGPDKIVVVGLGGGRIDHLLVNYSVLSSPQFARYQIDAWDRAAKIGVVHSERTIQGRVGELVSLVPIGGDTQGVTTAGLAYPLTDSMLTSSNSLGLSNNMTSTEAVVSISGGCLLIIQPERSL